MLEFPYKPGVPQQDRKNMLHNAPELAQFNLPTRVLTCLVLEGITTEDQLRSIKETDLWKIINLGKAGVAAVQKALA